jgi:flagellar protein FlaG
MDVTLVGGNDYRPSPPPMPSPGSGEFAVEHVAEVHYAETHAPSVNDVRAERGEDRSAENTNMLRRAVNEINSSIAMYRRHLGIRYHEATNRNIVTVYDSDTNEVIREIPPESVLEAHANMLEMVGLFVDTRG